MSAVKEQSLVLIIFREFRRVEVSMDDSRVEGIAKVQTFATDKMVRGVESPDETSSLSVYNGRWGVKGPPEWWSPSFSASVPGPVAQYEPLRQRRRPRRYVRLTAKLTQQ